MVAVVRLAVLATAVEFKAAIGLAAFLSPSRYSAGF